MWIWGAQVLLLALIGIGSMSGSLGGGFRVLRAIEATRFVGRELRLQLHPQAREVIKIGEGDLGPRFGYRAGLDTTLTIDRSDYGMTWGIDNGALGDEVKLFIALEGTRD